MPDEEADTVMQIRRTAAAGSTAGSAAESASTSTARPPLQSLDDSAETERQSGNVLEDLERGAAEIESAYSSSQQRKRRRREDEESWMPELRKNLQTNQSLLEKLMEKMLEDKEREKSQREPFISYVTQTLRCCSLQDFNNVKELISDILKQIKAQPSESSVLTYADRPTTSTSAPPAYPAASFGQYHQYPQQYPQHQQYFQPQPNYDAPSSWQYGVGGGGGGYQQQRQYPEQQQELQQPNLSTLRQPRASSESMSRALSAAIGEDCSFNMEHSNVGRVSQASMNTPPFSRVSPATHSAILTSAALGAPPPLSTPPAVGPTSVESNAQSVATQGTRGTRDSFSEDEDA
jgi:hypothetical protein